MSDGWWGDHLSDLSPAESWALLAQTAVGRLAWVGPDGMTVVPMNFAVVEHTLWLRTSPYSALARARDGVGVAFEADRVDEPSRSGWSVLVRGVLHVSGGVGAWPTTPEGVASWPEGVRNRHLAVEPTRVTGKRLG